MPSGRPAKQYPDHATVQVTLNMPGRVRNELADHVKSIGSTMNAWCGVVIRKALEEVQGLGPAPPAAAPIPTSIDILRQYLTGETVLEPCGRPYPCQREDTDSEFHGAVEYCGHCRIMVSNG